MSWVLHYKKQLPRLLKFQSFISHFLYPKIHLKTGRGTEHKNLRNICPEVQES